MKLSTVLVCAVWSVQIGLVISPGVRSSGGYRSSSSGGSSLSSGSYRATNQRSAGLKYSDQIKAGKTVSGIEDYRKRKQGSGNSPSNADDDTSDPSVCYTTDGGWFDNGTRTVTLGHFVCPYDSDDSDTSTFCCGFSDRQTCCEPGFWDTEQEGKIAGVTLAVLVPLGVLISVSICCCVCKKRKREKKREKRREDSERRSSSAAKNKLDSAYRNNFDNTGSDEYGLNMMLEGFFNGTRTNTLEMGSPCPAQLDYSLNPKFAGATPPRDTPRRGNLAASDENSTMSSADSEKTSGSSRTYSQNKADNKVPLDKHSAHSN